jgi:hypothetical protein
LPIFGCLNIKMFFHLFLVPWLAMLLLIWILICFVVNLLWQQMPTRPTNGIRTQHTIQTVVMLRVYAVYRVITICIGARQIIHSMADTLRNEIKAWCKLRHRSPPMCVLNQVMPKLSTVTTNSSVT